MDQALAKSASKEGPGEQEDETEYEDDSWSTNHFDSLLDNVSKENGASTKINPKFCLDSATMRKYITTRLPDFKAAENTFNIVGVKKPVFFYKEEVAHSKERVYIAFAHNEE
jgi:hypothetical protein